MKRTLPLLFAVIFSVHQSKGQFPYASIWSDFSPSYSLTSGLATTITPGFLWCGYQPQVTPGGFPWWPNNMNFFVRGYGMSSVWPAYKVYESAGCSGGLTQVLSGYGVSMIEANTNTLVRYAIAGAYHNGVYLTTLSAAGVPLNSVLYPFPFSGNSAVPPPTRPLVAHHQPSGDYIIAGGFAGDLYVLRVSASGSVIWSSFYSIPGRVLPKDILINAGSVMVVGSARHLANDDDGFLIEINLNNGATPGAKLYGRPSRDDSFNSIIEASSAAPGNGPGLVIAGSTQNQFSATEAWILKVDLAGSVIWSSLPDPSSGNNDGFVDVLERQNSFGNFEYYGVLKSASGMVVLKMDDQGQAYVNPMQTGNNEFVYNLPATQAAVPACISKTSGPANAPDVGIQVYGTAYNLSSANTSYFVSAYFNGETNCMRTLQMQNATGRGTSRSFMVPVAQYGSFNPCTNFQVQMILPGGAMNFPCSGMIASGSNLKEALATGLRSNEQESAGFSVYPNPSTGFVTVELQTQDQNDVLVTIQNNVGQLLFEKTLSPSGGMIKEEIDLQSLDLPQGVYFVKTISKTQVHQQKLSFLR